MNESYLYRLSNISEILSVIIIISGITFLTGWLFNIPLLKSPDPLFSTIKSNVALCFVFIGISLWLLQVKRVNSRNLKIAKILAVIIIIIGLLTLIEHLTSFNFGIDQLLFSELPGALNTSSPNRMAFTAALNLVLVGSAILVIDKNIKIGWHLFQLIIIIEGLTTFLSGLGYLYDASNLYMLYNYTGIAIYASFIFGLIFFAVAFIRPDKGFIGILVNDSPGSVLGRTIMPIIIVIPIIFGALYIIGLNSGFYDKGLGTALLVFSTIMVITTLLWISIISINKTDLKRRKAEEERQILLERTQQFAEELETSNEELQATTEELQVSNEELQTKNEELQQFAYIVSHDLQEPLRNISSFTQLLERRYKGQLDPNADEFIDYIVDGSKRMQNLIDDLLGYTKLETNERKFEKTKLEEVVQDVLSNLRILIHENIAEINHDPLPEIMGDKNQLILLFQNLIGNAIKFKKPDETPKIHISAHKGKNDREYIFSVSDNGIGIDPKQSERIFEVFKRLHTRNEYSGTGIGLAICRKIVERHGGRIWVESEQGKGSTFYFTIPVTS